MERKYTENMREISGFGGGYEEACRNMVLAGLDWLDANIKSGPKFSEASNIIGFISDDNEDAKNMTDAMLAVCPDCTGAMMQACVNHALYAHKNGWDKYVSEMTR